VIVYVFCLSAGHMITMFTLYLTTVSWVLMRIISFGKQHVVLLLA